MSEDEALDNFEVFFFVSIFFIGFVSIALSFLADLSYLGALPGVLIMALALNYYYQKRFASSRGDD